MSSEIPFYKDDINKINGAGRTKEDEKFIMYVQVRVIVRAKNPDDAAAKARHIVTNGMQHGTYYGYEITKISESKYGRRKKYTARKGVHGAGVATAAGGTSNQAPDADVNENANKDDDKDDSKYAKEVDEYEVD